MKTLKTLAIFCLSALLFTGCAQKEGGVETGLVLSADNYDIYDNNGVDKDGNVDPNGISTFTLKYNGVVVTEMEKVVFINQNNKEVSNLLNINGTDITFSSTDTGKTFSFKAGYGTMQSNEIRISVLQTPPPAPAAPEDTNESKTNFKRRVLLTQFTGTGCPNCPYMMNALYSLMKETNPLRDKVVLTAAHLYNTGDPAYLYKAPSLANAMGIRSYPHIVADMKRTTSYTGDLKKQEPFYAYVQKLVNHATERVAVKGGIAVNCEYKPEDGYVMVTANVKAKSTAEFRIGAWLVEDGIEATQSNNGIKSEGVDFNMHNNCIRVANSRRANNDYTGIHLGTIQKGDSKAKSFALPLLPNGKGGESTWNHDNLRVVVFISTEENGSWYVNNVISAPKNGVQDFEYEK